MCLPPHRCATALRCGLLRAQAMKQKEAEKEAQEDLDRMAQYAKVLEEQERKRTEMFKSFMERQEKLGQVRSVGRWLRCDGRCFARL